MSRRSIVHWANGSTMGCPADRHHSASSTRVSSSQGDPQDGIGFEFGEGSLDGVRQVEGTAIGSDQHGVGVRRRCIVLSSGFGRSSGMWWLHPTGCPTITLSGYRGPCRPLAGDHWPGAAERRRVRQPGRRCG